MNREEVMGRLGEVELGVRVAPVELNSVHDRTSAELDDGVLRDNRPCTNDLDACITALGSV